MTYRSALITGASSGIGRAFARILVPQTHLTLAGRRSAELTALAAEIAAPERSIETIAADLAIREERDTVIAAAKRAEIDLFICNAGIARAGPFGASAPAADYETIDINVIATVGLLHALIPPMIENAKRQKQRGGIVVVASVVALDSVSGSCELRREQSLPIASDAIPRGRAAGRAARPPRALPDLYANRILRARGSAEPIARDVGRGGRAPGYGRPRTSHPPPLRHWPAPASLAPIAGPQPRARPATVAAFSRRVDESAPVVGKDVDTSHLAAAHRIPAQMMAVTGIEKNATERARITVTVH